MANTPTIRTSGFSDKWNEQKLLELLVQPVSDGPHETPKLVEDGVPFISVEAIVDNKIDFNKKRGYITSEYDLECRKKYSPQKDDVYLVKSGATVGKVAIVDTDTRFNIWSPLAAMRTNQKSLLPKYLYYYLQLNKTQEEIYTKSLGGTQPNLSMRVLEQFDVSYPDVDEQREISNVFSSLDTVIDLQQKKLEKLILSKKAMLLKIFPQNGATVPEIRFDGFKDDWDKYKFGQLFEKNDALNDIGLGIEKTITVASMKYNPEGNGSAEASIPKYKLLRYGDIAFEGNRRKNHPYGKLVINDIGDGIMSARFRTLKPLVKPCVKFWKHYLSITEIFQGILLRSTKRGTLMNELVLEDLMEEIVYLPSEKEQEKIGDFFDNLDNLIALQEAKIEKLKKAKQALLNKMFV